MTTTQVLVVDDDPDVRRLAVLALRLRAGVTVHEADGGEAAFHILQTLRPDFVVLDVMMPGMDGPAVLQRMQATEGLRDIPVVFLTAKVQRQEVRDLQGLGAAGVLAKPFNPMTLADDLDDVLNRRSP